MNLKVIHILKDPAEGWEGVAGLVEEETLAKLLLLIKKTSCFLFVDQNP